MDHEGAVVPGVERHVVGVVSVEDLGHGHELERIQGILEDGHIGIVRAAFLAALHAEVDVLSVGGGALGDVEPGLDRTLAHFDRSQVEAAAFAEEAGDQLRILLVVGVGVVQRQLEGAVAAVGGVAGELPGEIFQREHRPGGVGAGDDDLVTPDFDEESVVDAVQDFVTFGA